MVPHALEMSRMTYHENLTLVALGNYAYMYLIIGIWHCVCVCVNWMNSYSLILTLNCDSIALIVYNKE